MLVWTGKLLTAATNGAKNVENYGEQNEKKKQANKTWKNIWHLQLNLPRACFASYKVEHLNVRKQPQIWDCKCLKYQMKVREG